MASNRATTARAGLATLAAAWAVIALSAGTAAAQDATVCSNAGNTYQVGDFACIAACHGQRRFARCDAVEGKASWTYLSEACPSAMIINPAWPSDWSEIPAVTAMSPRPIVVNSSAIAPALAPLVHRRNG